MSKINEYEQNLAEIWQKESQAGAELGQAQHQLELGFTLIKVCNIQLMIRNYHYISTYLHTSLLTCMLACLLTFLYTCLQRRPNSPLLTVNSNHPKSHNSHPLNFHRLYLVNFKFMIYLPKQGGSLLCSAIPCYLLAKYGQFQAASLLS